MNFELFQSTRKRVENEDMIKYGEEPHNYDETPLFYYVYCNAWWIQVISDSRYYSFIYNTEHESTNLKELEIELWKEFKHEPHNILSREMPLMTQHDVILKKMVSMMSKLKKTTFHGAAEALNAFDSKEEINRLENAVDIVTEFIAKCD